MLKGPERDINKNATCYQEYLNLFSSFNFIVVWTSGRATFTVSPSSNNNKTFIVCKTYQNVSTLVIITCQS